MKIGMNIHPPGFISYRAENLPEHLDYCKEMGCSIVRYSLTPETDEHFEMVENLVKLCEERGMEVLLCMDTYWDEISPERLYEVFDRISKQFRGRIRYYQMFNERDNVCLSAKGFRKKNPDGGDPDGRDIEEFWPDLLEEVTARYKIVVKAFRTNAPESKLIINYCWWHTGYLEYLDRNGVEWDITGIDWYQDMEKKSTIIDACKWLNNRFPGKECMICETNYWRDDSENLDDEEARFNVEFLNMLAEYDGFKPIAIVYYELLDELYYQTEGNYERESHFGFIACDEKGNNMKPKKAFYAIKERFKEIMLKD